MKKIIGLIICTLLVTASCFIVGADANITFNEVTGEGYINPGDTFTVIAPEDGDFVFILFDKDSGVTLYKSSSVHY